MYFFLYRNVISSVTDNSKRLEKRYLRAFNKVPVTFIKGFWQQKLAAVYEVTGIGGLFFSGRKKLRINQLTIKIEKEFNEIALIQDDDEVDITPEMVDLVCNELQ